MLATGGHRLSPKLQDFITGVIVTIGPRTHDRYFVRILEAAWHAHHICSPFLSDLHIAHGHAHILSSKSFGQRSIGHALQIDASGSEFFHAVKHAPLAFDKPSDMRLRSVKCESDASRLRGVKSFSLERLFLSLLASCLFCKSKGGLRGRKGPCVEERVCMEGLSPGW